MKKISKAIALKYFKTSMEAAPRLIAKGKGNLAKKIIEIAKENNIFIKEDSELVNMLYDLDLFEEIPEEVYAVIAEIFAVMIRMKNEVNIDFNNEKE